MKIVKRIVVILIILIAIPLIAALFINGEYAVVKETTINQSNATVFEYVKYLKNQDNFSVWNQMDPDMKKGLTGTDGEVGAIASWDSEVEDVGKGEQEIMGIEEGVRIDFQLRFFKPFESTGNAYFTTESVDGNQTKVQWGFDGEMPWPMNLMLLFMDFEKELGPALETGLTDLKKIMEEMPVSAPVEITQEEVEAQAMFYIEESSELNTEAIGGKIGAAYGEIGALLGANEIEPVGMPISITNEFSMEKMIWVFDCAMRVESTEGIELTGRVKAGTTYAGKVVKGVHVGAYDQSPITYNAITKYLTENGLEQNGRSWEEYVDDPGEVAPEEVRTFIYFPVK